MTFVKLEATEQDWGYWIGRPYLSAEISQSASEASVLLVPQEGFRDSDSKVFPVRTEEFFEDLKTNLPDDLKVEIAIEDDEYKEVALHSALVILGSVVVGGASLVLAPIVVNVVSEYLKRRLFTEKEQEGTTVRWELTVIRPEQAVKLTYEGPATEMNSNLSEAIAQISNDPPKLEPPALIEDDESRHDD